jgi:hypothetical protein
MNNPYAMLQAQQADENVLTHSVDRYSGEDHRGRLVFASQRSFDL